MSKQNHLTPVLCLLARSIQGAKNFRFCHTYLVSLTACKWIYLLPVLLLCFAMNSGCYRV